MAGGKVKTAKARVHQPPEGTSGLDGQFHVYTYDVFNNAFATGKSFDTIEKLQEHKGLVTGVPTGFTDLDERTSGFQPSDLVIVAARPSMGKTSFTPNIAQHVGTKTDKTVGFFSLEMSKEQLFMRLLTSEARIDAHRLRGGFLNERDYGKLSTALVTLGEAARTQAKSGSSP